MPTGVVTFLLSDVEAHGGVSVPPRGEGDSCFAVFARVTDAVARVLVMQRAFWAESWPTPALLCVRVAIHTGEAQLRESDYYGPVVNRCARIREIAHGGQTLLSRATFDLARDGLPDGATRSLGAHRLRDLARGQEVF